MRSSKAILLQKWRRKISEVAVVRSMSEFTGSSKVTSWMYDESQMGLINSKY
jgi:hypothetical protein